MGRSILVLALLCSVPSAAAANNPAMGVVVRVAQESDLRLLSRIEGQIADLEIRLVRHRSVALEPSSRARFARARDLARTHKARIVVWFAPAGANAVQVFVADPGRDSLFARRVATADGSARAEAVAIVVRSALQALAQGGRIGVRVEEPKPTGSAVDDGDEGLVSEAPKQKLRQRIASAAGWRWNLGLQGQIAFDGESSPGQRGMSGRVGLGRGRLQIGVVGVVGLSDQLRDSMTTVHLARHSVGVGAALRLGRSERSALWIGIDGGVIAYTRSTSVIAVGLTPAPPSTTVAGFAAPFVRAQWRPMSTRRLWVTAQLAAAAVVGAPALRYELAGAPVVRNELWPVQPTLGLGLRLEAP